VLASYATHPYRRDSYDEHGFHFRNTLFGGFAEARAAEAIINSNTTFRFAVVRHPWERLLSAYRSKYEHACKGSRMCLVSGYNMVHLDRSDPNVPVSFDEFVHALAVQNPLELDHHFRPATTLCELNRIPYDFLLELTSQDDADYLARRLSLPRAFHVVPIDTALNGSAVYNAKSIAEQQASARAYYGPQPCTYETVAAAELLYGADAVLLGYSFQAAYDSCTQHGLSSPPLAVSQPAAR
jgi:hypothetical protein